jgi:hypothetical protein
MIWSDGGHAWERKAISKGAKVCHLCHGLLITTTPKWRWHSSIQAIIIIRQTPASDTLTNLVLIRPTGVRVGYGPWTLLGTVPPTALLQLSRHGLTSCG